MCNGQQQGIEGDHNQQSGRDIINHNYPPPLDPHIPSAIEKVLSVIDRIAVDQSQFSPPDNKTYSIEEKIDFNQVTYFKPYDQYQEGYDLIRAQIITLSTIDPSCEKSIIGHVCSLYREALRKVETPDEIIGYIHSQLIGELNADHAKLTLEEKRTVDCVVFYVFAKCKIFDKPPPDYAAAK